MYTIAPRSFLGLEQGSQTNVVLGHDSVEHVVRSFGVGHGKLIELDQMLENKRKPEY